MTVLGYMHTKFIYYDHLETSLVSSHRYYRRSGPRSTIRAIACNQFRGQNHLRIVISYHFYIVSSKQSCTCSIWASKLHWLDNFLLYTVTSLTEIIALSGSYLLSFGKLLLNPVHFLLTEDIKKGNQGIFI